MKKGFFVVIEGVDGSGKTIQMQRLVERIKKSGKKILEADFPRYTMSEWGKVVGRLLVGEFGQLKYISPYLSALPYMLDEYTWSRDIGKKWVEKGGMIVSNRYFTSCVHQVAKLSGRRQTNFRDWLWRSGYEELGILKPDLVIFLDVPPAISMKLNRQKANRAYLKNKKADIAEKDKAHQLAAYKEYSLMTNNVSYWTRVRCVTGGKIDSVEVISESVWGVFKKKAFGFGLSLEEDQR